MQPIEGAIRALKEMRAMAIDVHALLYLFFIMTWPLKTLSFHTIVPKVRIVCAPFPSPQERMAWIEKHFNTHGTRLTHTERGKGTGFFKGLGKDVP